MVGQAGIGGHRELIAEKIEAADRFHRGRGDIAVGSELAALHARLQGGSAGRQDEVNVESECGQDTVDKVRALDSSVECEGRMTM
jgi:hypothetical protein